MVVYLHPHPYRVKLAFKTDLCTTVITVSDSDRKLLYILNVMVQVHDPLSACTCMSHKHTVEHHMRRIYCYLGDVGETSSNNARHLCLYEVVALRRDNGRVDEAKEDGTVHRVHA